MKKNTTKNTKRHYEQMSRNCQYYIKATEKYPNNKLGVKIKNIKSHKSI